MSEKNRLLLCAGHQRREGWKTLDCDPKQGADFIAAIPPLPDAVKAIEWDEIEWIHGITSMYPWDAEALLLELRSVLSAGGKLTLEQPDFRVASQRVEWLFGDAAAYKNPLLMNRWAYEPETLSALLRRSGFSALDALPAQHHRPERDFRIEARR